jgi:hypothetical protein
MRLADIAGLAVFLLCAGAAGAQDNGASPLHIDLYGNAQSARTYREIDGARVDVHRDPEHELPAPALREAVFGRVPGLLRAIRGFDALDRDRLFLLAAGETLERLRAAFPKIPGKALERLQVEVREEGFPARTEAALPEGRAPRPETAVRPRGSGVRTGGAPAPR